MYENIDDEAFIGRKQYFILMFRLTSLGWDYYLFVFFSLFFVSFFFNIYTYNLKHNASLTHVTSFRLMTPRPVGLKALGVETPLQA
jgi:hypothetical protein